MHNEMNPLFNKATSLGFTPEDYVILARTRFRHPDGNRRIRTMKIIINAFDFVTVYQVVGIGSAQ